MVSSQRPARLQLGEGQLLPACLGLFLACVRLALRPSLLGLCRRLFFLPLLLASRLRLLARHDHEDVVTHLADQPACPDERIEGIANRHLVEAHGDHARGRGRDDQADAIPLGKRAEGGLYVGSAKVDGRPIGWESLSAAFVLRPCRTRREHREEGEGDRGGNPHGHLLVVGAALKPGSSADLEPPSGALRITFPSAISTTRWPSTTSPTLTIWSLTMARLPPGNFTMPFTDTGALASGGATSLTGARGRGASTNLNGSRSGGSV